MHKLFCLLFTIGVFAGCSDENDPPPIIDTSYKYFLVAEKNLLHGDSFILPLKDEDDIAQAREMITDPQKAKIVVAEISKTVSSHVNKDLKRNMQYSWKVAGFLGFADTTIEIFDGWPQYVEDHYEEWVEITKGDNGNGRIGFWGYSIVREVDSSELK